MHFRRLGRTGLNVSEIGFGAWGIGRTTWIGADDRTSLVALKTARDCGINFFDTALVYGRGHSEELLAKAFGVSPDVLIASKVPPMNMQWPAVPGTSISEVFPKQHVLKSLDQTLRNLRRDCVELYQFHVWMDEWASSPEWTSTLDEIRRSGKARFIGISVNDHQPENVLRALQTGLVDSVQVIYNIFDQSPEDVLLSKCSELDIGIIGRVPFDEGSLTGVIRPGAVFAAGDFRNRYFGGSRSDEVWERIRRIVLEAGIALEELPMLALRFCLSHPAVSTVIPGMRTPQHALRNAEISGMGPLGPELVALLRKHRWVRNFYDAPRTSPELLQPNASA